MISQEILAHRLHNQLLTNRPFRHIGEAVGWMGAMQAQDFPGAKWSIALRVPGANEQDVEKAIAGKEIVRTWPMRGTLHFVAAADIRWMLKLLTPRIISNAAGRYRQLELDEKVFSKTRKILTRVLIDGKILTRQELYSVFENERIVSRNQRGIHILQRHAMEGLICFGPHEGKQPTFVLLEEWTPGTGTLKRDEALATLAVRYFTSHGPALIKDFVWWTGLTVAEAREAVELAKPTIDNLKCYDKEFCYCTSDPSPDHTKNSLFLLPGFDEYVLGYTDRNLIIDTPYKSKLTPGGGMFNSTIISNGKVIGTWKRSLKKGRLIFERNLFSTLKANEKSAIGRAEKKYIEFMGEK
jgi:hypothetical protein